MQKIIVALLLVGGIFSVTVSANRYNHRNYYRYTPQQKFYFSNIFRQDENSKEDDSEETIAVGFPEDIPDAPAVCTEPGYFMKRCTQYVRCVNMSANGGPPFMSYVFDCPYGTVFNSKIGLCDHEYNVPECNGQSIIPTASEGNEADVNKYGDDSNENDDSKENDKSDEKDDSKENDKSDEKDDSKEDDKTDEKDDSKENDKSDEKDDSKEDDKSDEKDDSKEDDKSDEKDDSKEDDKSDENDDSKEDDSKEDDRKPPGIFSLDCHDDRRYRKHPYYCNKYYACVQDENDILELVTYLCPPNLVFDDTDQDCYPPGREDESCLFAPNTPVEDGTTTTEQTSTTTELTDPPTTTGETTTVMDSTTTEVVPTTTAAPTTVDATTTEESGESSEESEAERRQDWKVEPDSKYDCPAPGFYPYENDCIRFYRCVVTKKDSLKSILYRCPQGYGFSAESNTCIGVEKMRRCNRMPEPSFFTKFVSATPLYDDDLFWFFEN